MNLVINGTVRRLITNMEAKVCFFLFALVCSAQTKPLGQTICESQTVLPGLLAPSVGSTTVCEASPNLLGLGRSYGLGVPYGLGSATVCETTSNLGHPLGYPSLKPGLGSTTVCESLPNPIGYPSVYGYPGGTTVCESIPNPLGYPPFYGYPGGTTVCDTVSNIPTVGGIGALSNLGGIGHPYRPFNNLGSTTVCESAPVLPYGMGSYLPGIGSVYDPASIGVGSTTVCESAPNAFHGPYGYRMGYPLGVPFL